MSQATTLLPLSETTWLSGASNAWLKDAAADGAPIGLLCQPGNSYELQIDSYACWAADNAAFAKGKTYLDFNFAKFDDFLDRRLARLTPEQKARCLFVNAPDAIDVDPAGNVTMSYPEVTLERFAKYAPRIRANGFPVALVGQPGMELMIDELPWDELDVLFLGGHNEWKLGEGAALLTAAARARGKKVHMGRVNSRKRFHYAASIGCSSADGTFLARARGEAGVARMLRWFPGTPSHPPVPTTPAALPLCGVLSPADSAQVISVPAPKTARQIAAQARREAAELDTWRSRRAA